MMRNSVYLKRAERAKDNYLSSIERAYGGPCQAAPAAFLLVACFIDWLGTLYSGKDSNEGTFTKFVDDFMNQGHEKYWYDGKRLYQYLRNLLVHNYSVGKSRGSQYALTHNRPKVHHTSDVHGRTILNFENFLTDAECAAASYFSKAVEDQALQKRLVARVLECGTMEDLKLEVEPGVVEPQEPQATSSGSASSVPPPSDLQSSIPDYDVSS